MNDLRPISRPLSLGTLQFLPNEIVKQCLFFLPTADIRTVSLVNRLLHGFTSEPAFWQHLCQRNFNCHDVEASTAKQQYRALSDLQNGRFDLAAIHDLTEGTEMSVVPYEKMIFKPTLHEATFYIPPMLFQSLQNQHDTTTPSPWTVKAKCLATLKREQIPQEALSDVNEDSYWQWNGTFLATLKDDKITIWKLNARGLTPCQTLATKADDEVLDFSWQDNRLVVIYRTHGEVPYRLDAWEKREDEKWALNSFNLPYDSLSNTQPGTQNRIDFFAWDGEWLAIVPINEEGSRSIEILRKTEQGVIEKTAKVDFESPVTSVKWNGNLLFAGDQEGNIKIWDRANGSIQAFEHLDRSENDKAFHDYLFIGNIAIITSNYGYGDSAILLLQQRQDGTFTLFPLYNSFEHLRTILHDQNSLYLVKTDGAGEFIDQMTFGISYRQIFKSLKEKILKLDMFFKPTFKTRNPETLNLSYDDAEDLNILRRLSRMPKSQKDKIMKEMHKIWVNNRIPRAFLQKSKDAVESHNLALHLQNFDPAKHRFETIEDIVKSCLYFNEVAEAMGHFRKTTYDRTITSTQNLKEKRKLPLNKEREV
ncbi:MAG: F-box protein [Parachlamydia sp.]|nr:F-box protein [Parachlamydia sp.]